MSDKRKLVEKFGSQSGRVAACESKGEAPSKPCDLPGDNAGMIEPPFRRLAKGYERFFRPGLDNIIFNVYGYLGDDEVRCWWWWESKAPDRCFAPESKPKEPKARELADGYARVREQKAGGRTLIFRDSEAQIGRVRVLTRHCWIEGQDDVPDHVYAPEPEPQEFREGDLLRLTRGCGTVEFCLCCGPSITKQDIAIETGGGRVSVPRTSVEFVHRCFAPTGPIQVGSYVGHVASKQVGIVRSVRAHPKKPYGVNWNDGSENWHPADRLIHLCCPEDH